MGSSELMRNRPIVLLWWIALSVAGGEQTMSDRGAPAGRRTLAPPHAKPLDPEQRLRDARAEYEARRRQRSHAIEPWTSIGPDNYGGRVNALAVHPTKAGTLYAASAGGGVWLTEDGGESWRPLTDDIPNLTVGAMALAPSAPNVLYVGSGEPFGSSAGPSGIGVIKSTDGGATWQFPSSVIADSFFRLSVHAQNSESVLAASPRGLHLTRDGGKTWNLVHSGCGESCGAAVTDIVRDPSAPDVVLAASPYGAAKIVKSTDGGATWSPSAAGLPDETYGRIALTAVAGKPGAFHAAADIVGFPPRIFSTVDGGATWTETPTAPQNYLGGQGWYDNAITASPVDGAIIGGGIGCVRSSDGGRSWNWVLLDTHVDVHDFAWQGTTLYIANDGGVYRSDDNGATGVARTKGLVTTQYYTIAQSALRPERVLAGTQDNGALVRDAGQEWAFAGGGDVFGCLIDPAFPDTMSIASQAGSFQRFDLRELTLFPGEGEVWGPHSSFSPPLDPGEPRIFNASLFANADNPRLLFTNTNRVWRSSDAGATWEPLSTRTNSGDPWTAGNIVGVIASSPTDPGFLYAVWTSPRGIYRSRDRGETWSPTVSEWASDIAIDPETPLVAYAAVFGPGKTLIATMDGGYTWEIRASGLPLNSSAHAIAIHPRDPQTLYCGTNVGLFRSRDRALSWTRIPEIPAVDVRAIAILPDGTVRVGTHGRGVWELRAASNNKGPLVEISSLPETVALGTTLFVTGRVTDPDGDATTATWHWSDGGQSVPYDKRSVGHLFARAGLVEVTLLAEDSEGAVRAATRTVRVVDAADSCATPGRIPSAGPFPFSVRSNLASATSAAEDPITNCQGNAGRSLWYAFTPAVSGTYAITTSSERHSPLVGVWTGDACGPFAAVTCHLGIGEVHLEFQAVAGTTYRIELLPFADALSGGPVTLTVERQHEEGPAVEVVSTAWLATDRPTRIVINGERFTSAAVVRIDGVEVESNVLTERVIVAFAKPHPAGPVDLEVITSAGRGVLRNALWYASDPIQPPGKHRAARH